MGKRLLSFGLALVFVITIPFQASASPEKEFIMSATYGVLAGTLVGAASLAFTDKPGDNLKSVARGASLGLYLGILLGLYVIYVVPGQLESEQQKLYNQPLIDDPIGGGAIPETFHRLKVFPIFAENELELDGAMAAYEVYKF